MWYIYDDKQAKNHTKQSIYLSKKLAKFSFTVVDSLTARCQSQIHINKHVLIKPPPSLVGVVVVDKLFVSL